MHHTAIYRASFNSAAETEIAAVQDTILNLVNSRLQPPVDLGLIAAAACGTTMSYARINTPTLRLPFQPVILPVTRGTVFPTDPNMDDKRANPLKLAALEEIIVSVLQASGGAEAETVVLFLSAGYEPAPRGNIFTLRGTGGTAAVAATWTSTVVTWESNLPNGLYAVVGLHVESTTCIAARLIFSDSNWRPGCLGLSAPGLRSHVMFRQGQLGVWGRFRQTFMPQLEIFCTAADATQVVYLDYMQIG